MSSARKLGLLNLQPYGGQTTELIVGIDVGTTFSGVCYAFLRPGQIPEVQPVTRFTDQTSGDSKIPSIMYYDEDDMLRAAGAAAVSERVVHDADYEEWFKVQYFKMHMRPSDMVIDTHGLELCPLPPSKTATQVMGEFLRYLYMETMGFIETHHADGKELLEEVSDRTTFVLSHPNGWAGLQQQHMREAAILGGLIEDSTAGRARVTFVSEGEASALSCLAGGLCPPNLEPGYRFVIADAGGGTLDMTSYEVTHSSPLRLKELTSSDCRFAGSVFVNIMARKLLQKKLRGSQYDNPEILDDLIDDAFENLTKREFRDATRVSWLRVGDRSENDTKLGIRRGSLRLDGTELASCFEFSITEALKSIKAQVAACGGKAMPVWLVGGFGASPWLLKKLKEGLERDGIDVSRPDINLSKAVAHGDVLYSLENAVISRVTRSTYGVVCSTLYQPSDPEHCRRRHLKYTNLNGDEMIPEKFDIIVNKNIEVKTTEQFTRPYIRYLDELDHATFQTNIHSYVDKAPVPKWYDENKDKFHYVCSIKADLSHLCRPSMLRTRNGKKFWKLEYEVEILFGLTELQARIKWVEKTRLFQKKTKYGPATIFYED